MLKRIKRSCGWLRDHVLQELYLPVYYRVAYWISRPFLGANALSVVIERSLFPASALRALGGHVGNNVRIHRGLYLHSACNTLKNLDIGDSVFIGARVLIDLTDTVTIEANSAVGMNVTIITHSNFGQSMRATDHPSECAPVRICGDAVINWGTIVNKGSVISRGCITLPGSVVAGTLRPGITYAGNPARPLPSLGN